MFILLIMTMIETGWDVRFHITNDAMEWRTRRTLGDAGKSKLTGRDEMNLVIGLDIYKDDTHGFPSMHFSSLNIRYFENE